MPDTQLMTLLEQRLASIRFDLSYGQQTSGQAGGQIRVANIRAPLWSMKVSAPVVYREEAQAIKALIGSLYGSVGTFYGWDTDRPYPLLDPTGAIVGSNSVQINSLGSDGISLSLKGLPNGYVLTRGDYVGFTYSSTKRALHQVVAASVVANSSGVTGEFEVHPAIRQGAAVNNPVSLAKPAAEFRLVPGSYNPETVGLYGRLSLEAIQVVT